MSCKHWSSVASAALLILLWRGALIAQTAPGAPAPRPRLPALHDEALTPGFLSAMRRVEPASARFTVHTERNLFRVSVPSNWPALADRYAVVFAPQGGYGVVGGQMVFTHGVEIGLAPRLGDDLQAATNALIDLLASDNPYLRRLSPDRDSFLANQPAVRVVASNVSEVTGEEERMEIATTILGDGRLFYALVVAPRAHFGTYDPTFRRVISSIAFIE